MELQRLGAEQERGLGGVPGQLRGDFGCSVMPPAFPAPCGLHQRAPQGECPAWITVNNPGFWTLQLQFGSVPGLLGLERSRLFPGFGEA